MEHDLVLEGRVVAPDGVRETEVGVSDGVIVEIGHGLKSSRRIKAERCLVLPGFVDIHVHMREPGWEYKEDFRTGTLAAVHGGVTTVADMPNNPSPSTTAQALARKAALAGEKGRVGVKLYGGVARENVGALGPLAKSVVGFKLFMSETTGTGGFPDSLLVDALRAVSATGKSLSIHCEDQGVIDRRRAELGADGRQAPYADLRPPEAETTAVGKVLDALVSAEGARVNVCHASTSETLRLVKGSRSSKVRCEAALHHLYFNRRALDDDELLRTNPPLRPEHDRSALVEGLADGTVSFLVTDHAPHSREEKLEKGFAGVPGLDDYAHLVSWLVRENGFDPTLIARVTSSNPARHLGLDDRGEISVGKRADFAILDIHSPEKVTGEQVMSKCGWSPYEGRVFPGRTRWTVYGGEVLLDDYEVFT